MVLPDSTVGESLRLTFSIGGTAKNRMASGKVMSILTGLSRPDREVICFTSL